MTRATIGYSSGLFIQISKEGHAPLLLLEWLSRHNNGKVKGKLIDNMSGQESCIVFRPENMMRNDAIECRDYINANLPAPERKEFKWTPQDGAPFPVYLDAILDADERYDAKGQSLHAWATNAESGDIWESKLESYQCI